MDKIWQGDPCLQILEKAIMYANYDEDFDCRFILSLRKFLENRGYLTISQFNKLEEIYQDLSSDLFDMDLE